MSAIVEVGSFVKVYVVDNGGVYNIDFHQWDEIDAAYHAWIERRIDRVLALTGVSGGDVLIAASRISDVCASTPDSRERDRAIEAAQKAESGFEE